MSNEGENNTQERLVSGGFWPRWWKEVLFLCITLGIGVAGLILWWFFTTKAVGTIQVPVPTVPESLEENQEKSLYQGKIIEFQYLSSYQVKSQSFDHVGPIVEQAILAAPGIAGRKVVVTVARRESKDLDSDPSFQMRSGEKEQYGSKPFSLGRWHGVVFQNMTTPFEAVAFFSSDGYIVSLAVTSLLGRDGLEDELKQILQSFRFSFQ